AGAGTRSGAAMTAEGLPAAAIGLFDGGAGITGRSAPTPTGNPNEAAPAVFSFGAAGFVDGWLLNETSTSSWGSAAGLLSITGEAATVRGSSTDRGASTCCGASTGRGVSIG